MRLFSFVLLSAFMHGIQAQSSSVEEFLLAQYPFNSDTSLLEDLSTQGLNGVVYGSPQLVPDRFGNEDEAWHFSPGDYVSIPSASGLNPLPFSVSVWFKPDLDQNNNAIVPLFKKYTPALWNGMMMYTRVIDGSNFLSGWYIRNSSNRVISQYGSPTFDYLDEEMSEDMWRHAVFTVDSTEGRLYFDGELQDIQPWDGQAMASTNSLPWQIAGTYEWSDTLGYQGDLDDVTIWNHALTELEVFELYSEGGFDLNGCTDPAACNYDFEALVDNGLCIYPVIGEDCLDGAFLCSEGTWWHPGEQRCYPYPCLTCPGDFDDDQTITVTDLLGMLANFGGECSFDGCTDGFACNYDPLAMVDDGSCVYGGVDSCGCNYDCNGALIGDSDGDGICEDALVSGCSDASACNYEGTACLIDDSLCIYGTEEPGSSCDDGDDNTFNDAWDEGGCSCSGTPFVAVDGSGPCEGEQTVLYHDYEYQLVEIGEQCWFAENLRTEQYQNGDTIPGNFTNLEWSSANSGAQSIYNDEIANLAIYGRLYNLWAVDDSRGLCPSGWQIPADEDWTEMTNYLDGEIIAGVKMKSSPLNQPSWDGTNSSGFSVLPAGTRSFNGIYNEAGGLSCIWSTLYGNSNTSWYRQFLAESDAVFRVNTLHLNRFRYGFSVRCIKDETIVNDPGCTDPSACNYNPDANDEDGSCVYTSGFDACGCELDCEGNLLNDTDADGLCDEVAPEGCMDSSACNYDPDYQCEGAESNCLYGSEEPGSSCDDGDDNTFNDVWDEGGCSCSGTPFVAVDGSGPCEGEQTVLYHDYEYQLVEIGEQCWFAENLRTELYSNQDSILLLLSLNEWNIDGIELGGRCRYGEGEGGVYQGTGDEVSNGEVHGQLYNWRAASDSRGLCPSGWMVPDEASWTSLIDDLGGPLVAGGKMMSLQGDWESLTESATNSSGFSALPSGFRVPQGWYSDMTRRAKFWSSTSTDVNKSASFMLDQSAVNILQENNFHQYGQSIRCIKLSEDICWDPDGDGICGEMEVSGCTDETACNYHPDASEEDGSCVYTSGFDACGCELDCEGNLLNDTDADGLCDEVAPEGCMDSSACNYDPDYQCEGAESNCFYGSEEPGSSCDDGDDNTIFDVWNSTGCECAGQPAVDPTGAGPCEGENALTYNGQAYGLVELGDHCWFRQNLRTTQFANGEDIPSVEADSAWANTDGAARSPFYGEPENSEIYGELYNWHAVSDDRGLCPVGWRVPGDTMWMNLESALGMDSSEVLETGLRGPGIGELLKAVEPAWNGTDASGFTALPGGFRTNLGNFLNQSILGYWWSTKPDSPHHAWYRGLSGLNDGVQRNIFNRQAGLSVRCVKGEQPVLCDKEPGAACDDGDDNTFNDVWDDSGCACAGTDAVLLDGSGPCEGQASVNYFDQTYLLVEIGSQCWFRENLATEHYANGDLIPGNLTDSEWASTNSGAQATFNDSSTNLETYGRLYNWYVVDDSRGLCPSGWHVPTDGEWTALTDYLGGAPLAGTAMKSSPGDSLSWDGTNTSGFSALPGGLRYNWGIFANEELDGYWWSASLYGSFYAWQRFLSSGDDFVGRNFFNPRDGLSVRCLRDD